jgi:hypothetical protein
MVKARKPETDELAAITLTGKTGDVVYQEGDAGTDMFVIEEGTVELTKQYAGEERPIAELETGDFFGEMSLLEGLPREATATARTKYKILRIDASTFDELIQVNPEIAVRMLRKLSRRLMKVHEAEARALEIARGALRPVEPAKRADKRAGPVGPGGTVGNVEAVDGARQKTAAGRRKAPSNPYLVHPTTGEKFDVKTSGVTTIGRYDRAAEYAPDVDFTSVSADTIVSRRHARILKKDDGYYLEEVDKPAPPNGTYVNGRRLVKGEKVRLNDGDTVAFGTLSTVFHAGSAGSG